MIRHWQTGESISEAKHTWQDLILKDTVGVPGEKWLEIVAQASADIEGWPCSMAARANQMQEYMSPPSNPSRRTLGFRQLPSQILPGATIGDQSLTCSAVAYCLAYDNGYATALDIMAHLRLSALTVGWHGDLRNVYNTVWEGITPQPIKPDPDGDVLERILDAALTVSSKRLSLVDGEWKQIGELSPDDISTVGSARKFTTHPLSEVDLPNTARVGLLLGGATKIKGYFMESAKLPEIRGASALLDRINLEDVPALFGRKMSDYDRFRSVRDQFWERTCQVVTAPECVIYAAGGSTLAFAPTSLVHELADEIERIYTRETLVANSVAVGETFGLLELQYGLKPQEFWVEEFRQTNQTDAGAILATYYGGTEDKDFFEKKCFGELTSRLASAQLRRREGNPTQDRLTKRDLPAYTQAHSYTRLCASCDRRPVIIMEPNAGKSLCEACARKYVTGRITKKPSEADPLRNYLIHLNGWKPASKDGLLQDWLSRFRRNQEITDEYDGPQDLADIAQASNPSGFIAVIYADGNNMGGYLENVSTPAQYRQFSERVFVALQRATFDALREHLAPQSSEDRKNGEQRMVYPFEIISIGGDDLMLIVPADKAFDIVHGIGQKFDGAFNSAHKYIEKQEGCLRHSQRYCCEEWLTHMREQLPAISLSLGFVIADEQTPFAFLEQLATGLLKSAKEKAKFLDKHTGYTAGTADFLVLKSLSIANPNIGEHRQMLRKEIECDKTKTQLSLTMRPFTLHELKGLTRAAQVLKEVGFPRNQLYQLRESLEKGLNASTLDYLYFRSRLTNRTHFEQLVQALERDWQGYGEGKSLPPWYATLDRGRETLLMDLMEIYDFVREPEGEEDA